MIENGILSGTDLTGKGRHRLRYEAEISEQELKRHLTKLVKAKLDEMMTKEFKQHVAGLMIDKLLREYPRETRKAISENR
jgi:hypothetical protein